MVRNVLTIERCQGPPPICGRQAINLAYRLGTTDSRANPLTSEQWSRGKTLRRQSDFLEWREEPIKLSGPQVRAARHTLPRTRVASEPDTLDRQTMVELC